MTNATSQFFFFFISSQLRLLHLPFWTTITILPLQELELRPETLGERHQRDRALSTCVICPTDGRDVTGGWRNRPGSIKARAVEPASAFVIQQPLLCVCLSISVGAYFCWLCLTDTQDKLHDSYKCKVILALGESRSHYRLCVPPCKRKAFSAGDTHSLCVVCLRAEQAESALEGADCPCKKKKKRHCVLALGGVLWVKSLHLRSSRCRPVSRKTRRSAGCARGNRRWIRWKERRRVSPYLLSFPIRSNARSRGSEARPAVLPPGERARRSACLSPRRWTWRMSMSFVISKHCFIRCYERENGVRAVSP